MHETQTWHRHSLQLRRFMADAESFRLWQSARLMSLAAHDRAHISLSRDAIAESSAIMRRVSGCLYDGVIGTWRN